jgi:hypothetical protein
LPYSLVILFHLIYGFLIELKIPKKKLVLLFCFILTIVLLLTALRGAIEGDYLAYKDIFNSTVNFDNNDLSIEPLYFEFNKIIQKLGLHFQVVIITMAVISVIPKYLFFYRVSPNFGFTAFIYFCTVYFIFDFIQIRQAVTISLFIFALKYLLERSLIPYVLIILTASLIHYSAVILLPGFYLFQLKYNKIFIYILILICSYINVFEITVPFLETILVQFGLPAISSDKILTYGQSTVFSAVSIKQLVLGFLFVFAFDNEKDNSSYHRILINLFVFGILFGTLFNGISEIAFRVKWYFFWTESLLMVYLIEKYFNAYFILKIFIYSITVIFYTYNLYNMLDEFASRGPFIFPYQTFFNF